MTVEYLFRLTGEHLCEGFARYRRARPPALRAMWVLLALALITVGVLMYFRGEPFPTHALPWLFLGCWILFVRWRIGRRVRRDLGAASRPERTVRVQLSDAGIDSATDDGRSQVTWAAFTKARRFDDGILLQQGPGLFVWLPDAAADPDAVAEADRLVRDHVRDYAVLGRRTS